MSQDPHRPTDPHRPSPTDQTPGQRGHAPAQPQQTWGLPPQGQHQGPTETQPTWGQQQHQVTRHQTQVTTSRPVGTTTVPTTPARPNNLPLIGGGLAALGGLLGLISQWLPLVESGRGLGSGSLWDYRDVDSGPSTWLLVPALVTLLGGLATLATRHVAAAAVTLLAALLFLWKAIQYYGDFNDMVDAFGKAGGGSASLGIAPWVWLLGSILGVGGAIAALLGTLRQRDRVGGTTL